jgi:nucleotide-binding universal stress UspA family protein
MSKFPTIKKILWAVDAFQPEGLAQKNVAATIATFAKLNNARVRLVYVPGIRKFSSARTGDWIYQKSYIESAEQNLKKISLLIHNVPTDCAIVPLNGKSAKTNEIDALLGYARKWGADVIAVATHAQNALVKLFIGSFAEGLIRHSRIPLLVVGPQLRSDPKSSLKNLLCPTDFSKKSRPLFLQTTKWAKTKGLQVIAIHGLTNTYLPAVLSDAHLLGGLYPPDTSLHDYLLKKNSKTLDTLLAACKKSGVKIKGEIYSNNGLISDIIVAAAKKHDADLIVMSTRSSSPARAGMGSVTKKVIRATNSPVLILK